jgi:hypothetical protein
MPTLDLHLPAPLRSEDYANRGAGFCGTAEIQVPSVLCPNEGSPPLLFRDRAASTLIAIEIEMVPRLRLAARGQMASLL